MLKRVALLGLAAASGVSAACPAYTTVDPATNEVIAYNNLHKIVPKDTTDDFHVEDSIDPNFDYFFQLCENTRHPCGPADAAPAAACQTYTIESTAYFNLGNASSTIVLDFPTSDVRGGVLVEYRHGDACANGEQRAVFITLECDPFGDENEPYTEIIASNHYNNNPCEYFINVRSFHACPVMTVNPCANHKTCGNCVTITECGWCSSTAVCHLGTAEGPSDVTQCKGTHSWHKGDASCVDCLAIDSCSACNAEGDCSWCKDDGCKNNLDMFPCETQTCSCPTCAANEYCPPQGEACAKIPNGGGMFVGGMFLGFGLVAIAGGCYYLYKKRQASYEGLA